MGIERNAKIHDMNRYSGVEPSTPGGQSNVGPVGVEEGACLGGACGLTQVTPRLWDGMQVLGEPVRTSAEGCVVLKNACKC